MSCPRLCSDGALQTAHDIWENWVAGASHAGDSFSPGLLADKGLLGSPYSQHGILQQAWGKPQYLKTFRAGADPGIILSVLVAQLVGRLGSDGFWKEDYGWGVRVGRPFGARRRSSVRYGTRFGDLKENWFILFSN